METPQKIHFIAIGGTVMHDLAIALKEAGHSVTGSDENIKDLVASKLLNHNLIPEKDGWFSEKIDPSMHAVIIGSHVKAENAELKRALELKLNIYSLPDFIYRKSVDKQRLVVTGSHGKTMITSIIIHVLNFHNRKFDYMVNAKVSGSEHLVRLSNAPLIIIEGQEVMASSIDRTPEFLKYQHHIGVISGIEWQKSEDYPTKDEYTRQFGLFGAATPKGGVLVYFELDHVVAVLSPLNRPDVLLVPYKTHASILENGQEFLITSSKERVPLKITGKHNLQRISAAQEAVKKIGITSEMFYQAIPSFADIGN